MKCVLNMFKKYSVCRCLISVRDGQQVAVKATEAIKGISCSRVRTAAPCSSRSVTSRSLDRPAAAAPVTTTAIRTSRTTRRPLTARIPSTYCHVLRSPAPIPACRSRSPWDRGSVSLGTSASSAGASSSAGPCLTAPRLQFMWEFYW